MALTRPRYSQIYDTDYKQSVRVATTADVGNLLATGNMTNSVDGVTLLANDRVLVKDQDNAEQNGIYRVITVGTGSNGTWERSKDANANDRLTAGMTTVVSEGDLNISKTFRLATPDPIVVGVTELAFTNPFVITASAGGANTQVQFNDVNQLGGSPAFTFNKTGNVLSVGGNINVTGSILPSANVTYDLGSPTQRWRDGWFSGTTIHIGTESMSVGEDGTWAFTSGGATVELGAEAVFNPPNANISGNVTATNYLFANGTPLMTVVNSMIGTANTNMQGHVAAAISTANVNLKGYVDGQFTSLINGSPSTLDTLNEIAAALGNDANLSVTLTSRITGVQGNITAANAAIVTANTNMKGYVDNGLSSLSSNRINANASNVTVTASFVNVAIDSSNVATFSSTGLEILTTTQSSSTTTGALIVDGGAGIAGNINAGNVAATNLTGALLTASQTNITAVGNLTTGTWNATTIATNRGGTGLTSFNHVMNGSAVFTSGTNTLTTGVLPVSGGGTGTNSVTGTGSVVLNISPGFSTSISTPSIINNGSAGVGNIGALGQGFNTVFARATSAQYADLAEVYVGDKNYIPGTVVVFGGIQEVTVSLTSHDPSVAGVVSTNPAYLMNDSVEGVAVALQGRVPCRVLGPVIKGDRVVTSDVRGVAERLDMSKYQPGCIIGKTLGSVPDGEIATIEVVVGRN